MGAAALSLSLVFAGGNCDSLNPSFVDLVDGAGTGAFTTLQNAPGHLVVQLVNNAEVDERLVAYLEGQGLNLTNAEKRALRPRFRMRINVTFTNGVTSQFEFVDGSTILIDPRFNVDLFPDLTQNDLDNAVVVCDVAQVEVDPNSDIEVFVPVELLGYELVTVTQGGDVTSRFELRETIPPQFRVLRLDTVDEDGNTVLQANIPVRRAPAPADAPVCGSVIAIEITGVLRVPFLAAVGGDAPSYDRQDPNAVSSIGGRYEFIVSVQ